MFFRRKVAKLLRKSRSANGQLLKPSTNSLSRKPANNGGTASLEELNYAAILRSVIRSKCSQAWKSPLNFMLCDLEAG